VKFTIRIAKSDDIEQIYSILLPYSRDGIILGRSKEEINKNIDNFLVAEIKNIIAGVVSYYSYSSNLKEIRSLAVGKKYHKNGVGAALVKELIAFLLKNHSKSKIFALSYVPQFFVKNGFVEVLKESLPEKIWKDCRNCVHQEKCNETALVYLKNL
jgi:N-acetylglutamate synthase-like GNAT family acetyltransferase